MGALRIRREKFWNAPNAITLGRIAASFLLLLLPLFTGRIGSLIMGLGFLAVSLTDLLDGYLARRGGQVTRIGKLLDPIADKVLVLTALLMLVATADRIPSWGVFMVVVILAREISVSGLRAMASSEGVVIQASWLGKWKAGFQSAAITCLLLHHTWFGIPIHAIGMGLLMLATALTLWSGYDYFVAYLGKGEAPEA